MPETPAPADRVAAYLAQVEERCKLPQFPWDWDMAAADKMTSHDLPRLMKVLDAVRELPAEWDARARALWEQIAAEPAASAVRAGLMGCTASGYQACAKALREAISRELLSEEADDGDRG